MLENPIVKMILSMLPTTHSKLNRAFIDGYCILFAVKRQDISTEMFQTLNSRLDEILEWMTSQGLCECEVFHATTGRVMKKLWKRI
jgi:hypothetical protein